MTTVKVKQGVLANEHERIMLMISRCLLSDFTRAGTVPKLVNKNIDFQISKKRSKTSLEYLIPTLGDLQRITVVINCSALTYYNEDRMIIDVGHVVVTGSDEDIHESKFHIIDDHGRNDLILVRDQCWEEIHIPTSPSAFLGRASIDDLNALLERIEQLKSL